MILGIGDNKGEGISNYYDVDRISHSDLTLYEREGPKRYKWLKDNNIKKETDSLILGEALHCKVLEPDEFLNRFYLYTGSKVDGMMGKFINELKNSYNTVDGFLKYIPDKLNDKDSGFLIDSYNNSGFTTKFDTVYKNFLDSTNIDYFHNLLLADGKQLLDFDIISKLNKMYSSLEKHPLSSLYLNLGTNKRNFLNYENEYSIFWENINIELKSKIDRIIQVAPDNYIIVDLKTTLKPLSQFKESYKDYKYYRQMAFYHDALYNILNNKTANISILIVVVESIFPYSTRLFTMSNKDFTHGRSEYTKLLVDINKNITHNEWDYFPDEIVGNAPQILEIF